MPRSEVTLLLEAMNAGDGAAQGRLIPLIYEELRRLAESHMRRERPGHTLQPTELVNEAYLRLAHGAAEWKSRAHFFGAAAEAMRRVLVDHARQRAAQKRGAGVERVTFDELAVQAEQPDVGVLELDEALSALEQEDARLCRVVHLRYFAGFSIEETAEVLEMSPATVKRDWTYARAWLYERMGGR
jgi:RNA polymerase sigma factor (TIGR02999 family)